MISHNVAFGIVLRELRKDKCKSQEALAFDAGFNRTYISLLELGKKSPTLDTIVALCSALDASPTKIIARTEAVILEHGE